MAVVAGWPRLQNVDFPGWTDSARTTNTALTNGQRRTDGEVAFACAVKVTAYEAAS